MKNTRFKRDRSGQPKLASDQLSTGQVSMQLWKYTLSAHISLLFCTSWHLRSVWLQIFACTSNPKNVKNCYVLRYFEKSREAILRPQDGETKKMTIQSGRQRAPKATAKNIHFPDIFCICRSSGSIRLQLPARPSFSK